MAVSHVDGAIVEATVRHARKKFSQFSSIVIASDDGHRTELVKYVAEAGIAARIQPGARGRFNLARTLDVKSLHGIRLADGTAQQAWPGRNDMIFLGTAIAAMVLIALVFFTKGGVPLLGALLLPLGLLGYAFTRSSMAEAKRQFETDLLAAPSSSDR